MNNTNVRCRIAGRNIYKGCGDNTLGDHYIIVTDTAFQEAKMNSTDTAGVSSNNSSSKAAFIGSDMWNLTLGANTSTGNAVNTTGINQTLYSIFGNSLIKYRDLSTNSIDTTAAPAAGGIWTGCSSDWEWDDCYATLLNECELYGGPIVSSSYYDIGIKKAQLPLFTLNPELIMLKNSSGGNVWYWLKNVSSGFRFCGCGELGYAGFSLASSNNRSLRLEFLLSA